MNFRSRGHVTFRSRGHVTNVICTSTILCSPNLVVVTYRSQLQSHVTFWLCGYVANGKNLYLHFHNVYGHQTWQSGNLQWGSPTFKVMWPFDYGVTWQMKKASTVCNSTIPMATKLDRVVTYNQETPPTKLRDLLITWSRDKCKTLYLHHRNTHGHQTWQSGNMRWRDPNFKVTWPFDYIDTSQMKKPYICTSTILMATKLGRVVTYGRRTPPSKSCDLLIIGSRDKWKKLIYLYLQFHNTYGYQTWQSGNLRWGAPCNYSHDLLIMWSRDKLKTL